MTAQLRIDLQLRGKGEAFPWARVEPMGDGVQLPLGVVGEVGAPRQVLAQQPIRVLGGAALPGAVRISKADLDREAVCQPLIINGFG